MATTNSQQLAKRGPVEKMESFLLQRINRIQDILPAHIPARNVISAVITEMQRTPKLQQCTPASLVSAVFEIAQAGLVVSRVEGLAYILPFKNKAGQYIATPVIGYKGYIRLAYQGGFVKILYAEMVYEEDVRKGLFNVQYGSGKNIYHMPDVFEPRGKPVGAYAFVQLHDGGSDFVFMTKREIELIKKRSPGASKKDSPWNHPDDFKWMWKKTVLNQLNKTLPLGSTILRYIGIEERAEAGIDYDPTIPEGIIDEGEIIDLGSARDALENGAERAEDEKSLPPKGGDGGESQKIESRTNKAKKVEIERSQLAF